MVGIVILYSYSIKELKTAYIAAIENSNEKFNERNAACY
jgi:hypothetical protein